MEDQSVELQDVIIAALKADASVAAIVGDRVYDRAPEGVTFPYISLGATNSIPEDADCIDAESETVQIDIWHRDQGRKWKCKATVNAVRAALHEADLDLDTNALALMRVTLTRVQIDPDNITAHGIVQVEAIVEEGGS